MNLSTGNRISSRFPVHWKLQILIELKLNTVAPSPHNCGDPDSVFPLERTSEHKTKVTVTRYHCCGAHSFTNPETALKIARVQSCAKLLNHVVYKVVVWHLKMFFTCKCKVCTNICGWNLIVITHVARNFNLRIYDFYCSQPPEVSQDADSHTLIASDLLKMNYPTIYLSFFYFSRRIARFQRWACKDTSACYVMSLIWDRSSSLADVRILRGIPRFPGS